MHHKQYTYLLDYTSSSTLHEKISVTQCSKETKFHINEEHNYRYIMCITNVIIHTSSTVVAIYSACNFNTALIITVNQCIHVHV